MSENYTIRPGDFLISTNCYNDNKAYAIFEGKEVNSTTCPSAKPDYTLLIHYESKPYSYSGFPHDREPHLEVATKTTPCSHKIYIIENSTMWRKCTEEEKEDLLAILEDNGYIWNEDTWSLVDAGTGEIINSIIKPKLVYNGTPCKKISNEAYAILLSQCVALAKDTYSSGYNYNSRYPYAYSECYD